MTDHINALPKGYRFEEYELIRVLGSGGFGITYLAFDDNLDLGVAIKEYLPNDLAVRQAGSTIVPKSTADQEDFDWGLERFLEEARTLARFKHNNIIQVHRFFRAHGSAYIVMEYAEGEELSDVLKRKGKLSEDELKAILLPVMDGLARVHKANILHRDIKPANIMIRTDGSPVLIDFGAARQAIGAKSRSITAIVSAGYAPLEQYLSRGNQGPWSDIYALGATAYKCLTGKAPPESPGRTKKDPYVRLADSRVAVSGGLARAIDNALEVDEEDRPQTIRAWKAMLEDSGGGRRKPPDRAGRREDDRGRPPDPQPDRQPRAPRTGLYVGLAAALLVLIGGIASYMIWPEQSSEAVLEAQEQLNRLGYSSGRPDGLMSDRTRTAVRRFADDQGFQADGIDAFFLEKLIAEIRRRDDAAWQTALSAGTEAALEVYRRSWPRGGHARDVDPEISRIKAAALARRDEAAWEQAKLENSVAGYEAYRAAWPNGGHASQVDSEIARLKAAVAEAARLRKERADERAWAQAKKTNTVKSFEDYRRLRPGGKYVAEVDREIARLRDAAEAARRKAEREKEALGNTSAETAAWKEANRIRTVAGYKAYLNSYPNGKNAGQAQNLIGFYYLTGRSVTRNDTEAIGWFRLSVARGYAAAQYNLGSLYSQGRGVPKNDVESVRLYRMAANQGHAKAQSNLGFMYDKGRGVAKNEVEAVRWYRLAADQGNAVARHSMGISYKNGRGVAKNDVEAVRWYRLSADQGYAPAQSDLGYMYSAGRGVAKNEAEAFKWFRKAANQNNAIAQDWLAAMYKDGRGVTQNNIEAYKWYRISLERGYAKAADKAKNLASKMTKAEISEGQRRATAWLKANPKS